MAISPEPSVTGVSSFEDTRQASRGSAGIGNILIGIILFLLALAVLFPFYNVLIVSLGTPTGDIFPTTFSLNAYTYILGQGQVVHAFLVSLCVVVVGTIFSLLVTTCTAYALSRKVFPGKKIILGIIVFTMFFGGGLVPWYIVIKNLGLINNYLVLILPSTMNAFYMIVMLTFFRQFPAGLEESARIDGANDWTILTRIVIPTSTPVMATIGLFYAVDRWNDWFTPLLFLSDPNMWPLQLFTQQFIINSTTILQSANGSAGASSVVSGLVPVLPDALKMAVIVIGIVPIMLVYPFLQKYFAKGVMIGSLKG